MSDVVIRAEGLGKKYRIRHQGQRLRYVALRDVFAHKALAPWRWLNARRVGGLGQSAAHSAGSTGKFEDFWALKDVSFQVNRGEVLGIIGRNGAGKSTLLKILSRITEPSTGRARIRGRVASLLEVGTGFHPELTGRENILLNGAILGMSRAEIRRRFDEIVAFGEIEKFLDTPVKRYSSGMYVRLAFAVAAHLEPDILVVDEVLSVGDAAFQEKCLGKMDSVAHEQGRTVLLVSHNMAAVQQLCGRALLVQGGCLAGDGEPAALVRKYLDGIPAAGKVCLRDWKDRVTNGDGAILDFETIDEAGQAAGAVMFGSSVRFRFTIELYRRVPQPIFGVLVHSAAGEAMLDIRSAHSGLRMAPSTGRIVVEAEIEQLGLYPGEYTLSPWVADDSTKLDVDYARHCCSIRVLPAPGVHGDLDLNPIWGKYWVPSSWCVVDRGEAEYVAAAVPATTA
jgi:lipopolysaccharide transport system ATP-binding protein